MSSLPRPIALTPSQRETLRGLLRDVERQVWLAETSYRGREERLTMLRARRDVLRLLLSPN
jgi:hypothetical protein